MKVVTNVMFTQMTEEVVIHKFVEKAGGGHGKIV